jgi:DNA processing protein
VLGVGREGPLGIAPTARPPAGSAGGGRPAPTRLSERDALTVLATVDGLGLLTLARLIARMGSAQAVVEAAAEPGAVAMLLEASRDRENGVRAMPARVAQDMVALPALADTILEHLARSGLTILTVEDPDYPARLRAIELPPHVLFVRGNPAALASRHAVAVVGTRRPSEAGRLTAARIGAAIARAGAVVVSGLAVGIDGAAHAAVVAESRPTVAVLGGGHERLFPLAHRRLADAIVATGGALVSEFAPRVEPRAGTFPRRNRIISGLSEATVVVEAGASSGSLITAQWALEQGRDCFLVPGSIDSRTAAGCLAFLREFPGQARIVAGIPQLLEDLAIIDPQAGADDPTGGVPVAALLIELGSGPRRIAAELLRGRTTADELVATTGLPVAGVLAALTLLESRGLVAGVYGRYRPVGRLATAVRDVFAEPLDGG